MPIVCVNRPNRSKPRHWTAANAISAACSAISHGASVNEIVEGVLACPTAEQAEQQAAEAQVEALEIAASALQDNNALLEADLDIFRRFTFATTISALAFRLIARIPVVGPPVALALQVIRQVAVQRVVQINARKAANDAVYNQLQRTIATLRRAA